MVSDGNGVVATRTIERAINGTLGLTLRFSGLSEGIVNYWVKWTTLVVHHRPLVRGGNSMLPLQ